MLKGKKLKKSKQLNFWIAGLVTLTFSSFTYAQTNPANGECRATSVPANSYTASHYYAQNKSANNLTTMGSNDFHFICGNSATITLSPNGILNEFLPPWLDFVNLPAGSVTEWWSLENKPQLQIYVRAMGAVTNDLNAMFFYYARDQDRSNHRPGEVRTSTPRSGAPHNVTIRVMTSGRYLWHERLTANFGPRRLVANVGRAGRVYYDLTYTYMPPIVIDPCLSAYSIDIEPSRINLGTRSNRGFPSVKKDFTVNAIKKDNSKCTSPTTPKITFNPEGGTNIDNTMYLDNGSEIIMDDATSGQPVKFGIPISMEGTLNGDGIRGSKVSRDYRLTWRPTPGKKLITGDFTKVMRVVVEFP